MKLYLIRLNPASMNVRYNRSIAISINDDDDAERISLGPTGAVRVMRPTVETLFHRSRTWSVPMEVRRI